MSAFLLTEKCHPLTFPSIDSALLCQPIKHRIGNRLFVGCQVVLLHRRRVASERNGSIVYRDSRLPRPSHGRGPEVVQLEPLFARGGEVQLGLILNPSFQPCRGVVFDRLGVGRFAPPGVDPRN